MPNNTLTDNRVFKPNNARQKSIDAANQSVRTTQAANEQKANAKRAAAEVERMVDSVSQEAAIANLSRAQQIQAKREQATRRPPVQPAASTIAMQNLSASKGLMAPHSPISVASTTSTGIHFLPPSGDSANVPSSEHHVYNRDLVNAKSDLDPLIGLPQSVIDSKTMPANGFSLPSSNTGGLKARSAAKGVAGGLVPVSGEGKDPENFEKLKAEIETTIKVLDSEIHSCWSFFHPFSRRKQTKKNLLEAILEASNENKDEKNWGKIIHNLKKTEETENEQTSLLINPFSLNYEIAKKGIFSTRTSTLLNKLENTRPRARLEKTQPKVSHRRV